MPRDEHREDPPLGERVVALEQRVTKVETDLSWIKSSLSKIETRMWWVLGSVVALGIISILVALLS